MNDAISNTVNYGVNTGNKVGNMFMEPLMSLLPQAMDIGMKLLAAIIILLIGNFVVGIIMKIVKKALGMADLDGILSKVGVKEELNKAGLNFSLSNVISGVIRLILKLVVWMAVINVLGIEQLTNFMNQIISYMPNVLVAILILGVGLTIAKKSEDIISNVADNKLSRSEAGLLGKVAKYAILTITVMTTLVQLQIGGILVETLFAGMVAMMAIAGGIAFGLGGQEKAKGFLERVTK